VAKRIPAGARALDLVTVAMLAPLLVPLCLIVSLMVFLDSPGSIFYRARRIGLGGRPFPMLKFRTMRSGSSGPALTRGDDERFTPIGRFLASARLDELPQVWHVLKGEMRIVGPRPEDEAFVQMYSHEYEEILSVPPGIMGRAQLIHFADAATLDPNDPLAHYAEQILPGKLKLDAGYVRNRSLGADLSIIGQTVLLPLRVAIDGVVRFMMGRRAEAVPYLTTAAIAVIVLATYIAAGGSAR
jgi:lipopolysaccharide/colanic/teichoic acid biosynthesis glycosyltransferase